MGAPALRTALLGLALLRPIALAALSVEPVTEGPVLAAPRSVAAFGFVIRNEEGEPLPYAWSAETPRRWSPLGPLSGKLDLAPGESRELLLLLAIPAESPPGTGEVVLRVWPMDRSEAVLTATLAYSTAAAGRLHWLPNGQLPDVFEGDAAPLRAYLENASNVETSVAFSGTSSLGGRILAPELLTLGPGEGRWVEATVVAGSVGGNRETETIFLVASTDDLPLPGGRADYRVARTVLARRPNSRPPDLRGTIQLEGVRRTEDENALGFNLRLQGSLDPHRRADLRIGEALPLGEPGAFARRETRLTIEDDRWGGYMLGRTSMPFSRLTAAPQWGEWASLWANTGAGTLRGFTSISDPRETRGRMAGVQWSAPEAKSQGLRAFAYRADAAPNGTGGRFSMGAAAGWARWGATTVEAEAATALGGAAQGASGWRLAATGARGRVSWSGEARRAAAEFPGAFWNEGLLWASLGYQVAPRFQVWGSRERMRSPNLLLAPAADESSWEGGFTWAARDGAWLSLGRRRTAIGVTASEPVSAVERLWTGRLDLEVGDGLIATGLVGWGERREAGADETIVTAEYSLRYRPSPGLQVTARVAPAPRSNTVFEFRDRWSVDSRWQMSPRAWISLQGQGLRCGAASGSACENDPTYRLSLGTALGGGSEWTLTGYAQRAGGGHEVVAGIQVGRAIAVRSPLRRPVGRVEGTVRLATGAPAPAGIRVRMDGQEAVTGDAGRFVFPAVPKGDYALIVVLEDLGLAWIPDTPTPPVVRVGAAGTTLAAVTLTRPGAVLGQVSMRVVPASGNGNGHQRNGNGNGPNGKLGCGGDTPGAAPPDCWPLEAYSGLGVRFTSVAWPDLEVIAVSDEYGRLAVAGFLPGRWTAEVIPGDVPDGRTPSWLAGGVVVDVVAAATVTLPPLILEHVLAQTDITPVDLIVVSPSR